MKHYRILLIGFSLWSALGATGLLADDSSQLEKMLGISFSGGAGSMLIVERDGRRYQVDIATKTIQEIGLDQKTEKSAAALFQQNCATCHGSDGKGAASVRPPDFTNPAFQRSVSGREITNAIRNGKANGRMPAWAGKLSDAQINNLAAYVRSFVSVPGEGGVYEPADDLLFSLPTGREVDRHGIYVNFTHRFPYDPAFSGPGRGGELFGLDNFALASFGLRYGITDKLSVSAFRSPSIIGRPIQLMVAYNILDEHHEDPFNIAVRVSIEGQNNFRKNYTQNIEGIFSRSITREARFILFLRFRSTPGPWCKRRAFFHRRSRICLV
jgi:cytochrome c553